MGHFGHWICVQQPKICQKYLLKSKRNESFLFCKSVSFSQKISPKTFEN